MLSLISNLIYCQNKPSMDFITSLNIDSSRTVADMVTLAVDDDPTKFEEIFQITISQPYPISMRAARVFYQVCEFNFEIVKPYLGKMIEELSITKIDGVKRAFLKIYTIHPIKFDSLKNSGKLISLCFDWLMNPKESIAVRAYAMDVIEIAVKQEPELAPEFIAVVESILDDDSIGLRKRAQKFLKIKKFK